MGIVRKRSSVDTDDVKFALLASFRCLECEHMMMISRVVTNRARALRCDRCGGRVEETDASRQRATQMGREERPSPDVADRTFFGPWCRVCGRSFRNPVAMKMHVAENHLRAS